jgi:hypothetical protein
MGVILGPMIRIHVYWGSNTGLVLIPTLAKTEAGFWLEVDPVEVAKSADDSSIAEAIQRCLSRGNASVPTPGHEFPRWVLLKIANKKRVGDIAREYKLFSIEGGEGSEFLIRRHPVSQDGRGYVPERNAMINLGLTPSFENLALGIKALVD